MVREGAPAVLEAEARTCWGGRAGRLHRKNNDVSKRFHFRKYFRNCDFHNSC